MLEVMGHIKRLREFDRLFRAHEYEAALEQVSLENFWGQEGDFSFFVFLSSNQKYSHIS